MAIDTNALKRAVEYHQQNNFDAARNIYLEQLALQPEHTSILLNLGLLEHQCGNHEIGLEYIDTCIKLEPDNPNHIYNKGAILERTHKYSDAILCFEKVSQLNNSDAEVQLVLGNCYFKLNNIPEAMRAYERSLSINPDNAEANCALGKIFLVQGKFDLAETQFDRAIDINNYIQEAYIQKARSQKLQGNIETAIQTLKKHIKFDDDATTAFVDLIGYQLDSCSWENYYENISKLHSMTKKQLENNETTSVSPFRSLQFEWEPSLHHAIAKSHIKTINQNIADLKERLYLNHTQKNNKRIKIGYISSDFRDHTVAHLCQGLFSTHNREKFEIYAYTTSPDDNSNYRKRIVETCDDFIDLTALAFHESAQRIHQDNIDILVDLTGHTNAGDAEILAYRPAPIQINYLGFLGTMGADFIDYIITDKIVTPPEDAKYYSEKFIFMPHTYQINSHNHPIAETPTRESIGLPEDKFIFCCFNNNYKITPKVFDAWMEILKQQDNAIIWLYETSEFSKNNLIKEAKNRGINSDRLFFATSVPREQHLARLRCADLYLDTFIASARTSASDALWAGLPILTLPGKTFSNRVGASLLSAVGREELITTDVNDYINKAIFYAQNPTATHTLKEHLHTNIKTEPLFDTERFVRNLEKEFEKILT